MYNRRSRGDLEPSLERRFEPDELDRLRLRHDLGELGHMAQHRRREPAGAGLLPGSFPIPEQHLNAECGEELGCTGARGACPDNADLRVVPLSSRDVAHTLGSWIRLDGLHLSAP